MTEKDPELDRWKKDIFPRVWDMYINRDANDLWILYGAGSPLVLEGDSSKKFYVEYKKFITPSADPSARITPLEQIGKDGVFCYETARANIRKTMSIDELDKDDKYHAGGDKLLDAVFGITKACDDYQNVITHRTKCLKRVLVQHQELFMTDMVNPSDMMNFTRMLEQSININKQIQKLKSKATELCDSWMN